jgi:putative ABC transport system substrate-binding protein
MNKKLGIALIAAVILIVAVILVVIFVGGAGESAGTETVSTIGISKIVAHPALDAVEQGIQDELTSLGYELNYDLQNANGDLNTATSIANKFRADKVALAVGIATPTAQALVNTLKDIPVVYSAVTDPVGAGLVASIDKGGMNVTGISDLTPVKEQLELLMRLQPDIKAIGHVYSSGESNAVALAELAEQAAKELGLTFVPATVTNSAEVRTATQTIIDKVDAIYVSTDNTVVSALNALVDIAARAGKPVMSADPSSAEEVGVLAAWGFDYYKMGRATGRLIARLLDGESTESIPTQYMTDAADVDLLLNLDVAKELGITVPADVKSSAATLVENGQVIKQ